MKPFDTPSFYGSLLDELSAPMRRKPRMLVVGADVFDAMEARGMTVASYCAEAGRLAPLATMPDRIVRRPGGRELARE